MNISDILPHRLHNQRITNSQHNSPEDIVAWMGAVQSQDYTAAKWALGLRTQNIKDADIEDAFNQGRILRTHVMRPTWHFVSPKDIRWLLRLTRERVHKQNQYYYRLVGLDTQMLEDCMRMICKELQSKTYLTRDEIRKTLEKTYHFKKEVTLAMSLILIYAELEGAICSGPRHGKQFTYALLEERVPQGTELDTEASLAELTLRYFQSHGPATLKDFIWWSGLTSSDAQKGIALQKSLLTQEKINGNVYWFINAEIPSLRDNAMFLLPNYDEYIVGYTDREFIFDTKHLPKLDSRANPLFQNTILLDGKVVGTWRREFKKNSVELSLNVFTPVEKTEEELLKKALNQFGTYMNQPINVSS